MPTWAAPAGEQADRKLVSAPALSELDLLREPLSVAAHTAGEHVRELESSGAFSLSDMKPALVEDAPKLLTWVRALPRLQKNGNCLGKVAKKKGNMRNQKELLTAPARHVGHAMVPSLLLQSWFNAPPGLGLPTGAGPDDQSRPPR